ncbi:pilin [Cobetia amphilecti]|nr:pilin [Cobetia amphilecti]
MSRAYSEMAAMKTAAEEAYARGVNATTADALGWTSSDLFDNDPTVSITADDSTDADTIAGTLNGNVSGDLSGTTLTLTRTASDGWTCALNSSSAAGDAADYAPSGCTTANQ